MMLSYPDDVVIHTIRQEENKLLASIFSEGDTSKKEAILQSFIQLRKYRAEKAHNIIKQEFLSETIEGMAEYAGCMALKQLSPNHYRQVIQNNINILADPAPFFFDIRKMSYYTGSMLCLALSETGTSFYHEIGKESLSLFELISKEVPPKSISISPSTILIRMLEKKSSPKGGNPFFFFTYQSQLYLCTGIHLRLRSHEYVETGGLSFLLPFCPSRV